jgi:hypothetical protein
MMPPRVQLNKTLALKITGAMEHVSNLGNERGIVKRDRVGVCEATGDALRALTLGFHRGESKKDN